MDNIEQIREHAANWLVLMDSSAWNDIEEQNFNRWLRESLSHRSIFLEMQSIMHELAELGDYQESESLRQSVSDDIFLPEQDEAEPSGFWLMLENLWQNMWMRSLSIASLPALAILVMMMTMGTPQEWSHEASGRAQTRELVLQDGTHITLGAMSDLSYRFNNNIREVNFTKGQAFFNVAKDSSRPFIIRSGATQIEVVGTQFDVRKNRAYVDVAVLEGKVKVGANSTAAVSANTLNTKPLMLTKGQGVSMKNGQSLGDLRTVELADIALWKNGRLSYINVPLSEIIYDVNRYYSGNINILGRDLADLKVTASFSLDKIDSLAVALEKMLPIKVINQGDGNLLLAHKG